MSEKIRNTIPFTLNGRDRVCIGEVFISAGPAARLSVVMSAPPEGAPVMSGGVAVELLARALGMIIGRFVVEGNEDAVMADVQIMVKEGIDAFRAIPTRQ